MVDVSFLCLKCIKLEILFAFGNRATLPTPKEIEVFLCISLSHHSRRFNPAYDFDIWVVKIKVHGLIHLALFVLYIFLLYHTLQFWNTKCLFQK